MTKTIEVAFVEFNRKMVPRTRFELVNSYKSGFLFGVGHRLTRS